MPGGVVDERAFNWLRRARDEAGEGLTLGEFKHMVREQFLMLQLDERRAIEAIPSMLAQDSDLASGMAAMLVQAIEAVGLHTGLEKARFAEVHELVESSRTISRLATGAMKPVDAGKSRPAASRKHWTRPYVPSLKRRLTLDEHSRVARIGRAEPSPANLVETKGLGSALCFPRYSVMAALSSATRSQPKGERANSGGMNETILVLNAGPAA
jgi:hypothetical protein